MKVLLLGVALSLLLLTGCEEERAQENRPQKPPEDQVMKKTGIEISDEKISIDLNKTRSILDSITKKGEEIAEKIERGDEEFQQESGVIINSEKIEIDMTKTADFLNRLFEGLFKEN
jgi:hypothetical protein